MVSICYLAVQVHSVYIIGQTAFSVVINGNPTLLTVAEITVSADNDILEFAGRDRNYTLHPTWSFFGQNPAVNYTKQHYHVTKSCGCGAQICGLHCDNNVLCRNEVHEEPLACWWPGVKWENYCWALIPIDDTPKQYTSHYITHLGTIALTEYGGPESPSDYKPGETIKNSVKNQNYSYNAKIVDWTPRKKFDMSAYRYAESDTSC